MKISPVPFSATGALVRLAPCGCFLVERLQGRVGLKLFLGLFLSCLLRSLLRHPDEVGSLELWRMLTLELDYQILDEEYTDAMRSSELR